MVTTADRIWVTLDFMEAVAVAGYTGMDSAVPTGAGPPVADVTSLSARARFTPAQPQRILDTRSGEPARRRRLAAAQGRRRRPGAR